MARKFCMNRYITANTSSIASSRVLTTFLIEISTNAEVS